MNRRWRSKVCLKKTRNNQQINEVQLDLISTWTLHMVIEISLVPPVETKQVRKVDLNWTCFLFQENGTVPYRIVPISGSLFGTDQFLDLFWNGLLDFFPYPCERNPSPYHFVGRNGTVRYRTRVNRPKNVEILSGLLTESEKRKI